MSSTEDEVDESPDDCFAVRFTQPIQPYAFHPLKRAKLDDQSEQMDEDDEDEGPSEQGRIEDEGQSSATARSWGFGGGQVLGDTCSHCGTDLRAQRLRQERDGQDGAVDVGAAGFAGSGEDPANPGPSSEGQPEWCLCGFYKPMPSVDFDGNVCCRDPLRGRRRVLESMDLSQINCITEAAIIRDNCFMANVLRAEAVLYDVAVGPLPDQPENRYLQYRLGYTIKV
jgi:hypothetical protein